MFIKSPFNYIGGKYRILPQILPLFPKNINTMIDVFSGGFTVGINTPSNTTICNDQLTPIIQLHKHLHDTPLNTTLDYIHKRIHEYGLSKTDKDSFKKFRHDYNTKKDKHPLDLYILMCFSYNYQARWNNKHQYNSSHGTNRSSYTRTTEKKLIKYTKALQKKNIQFEDKDFTQIKYEKLTSNDFAYFDPPYILSIGNYNDGNRGYKNWTTKEEQELYTILQTLTDNETPFGLNNLLSHKGKHNKQLEKFIQDNKKNLKVYHITNNYNNSSYNNKKNNNTTTELYITNEK